MKKYYEAVPVEKELPEIGQEFIGIDNRNIAHTWNRGHENDDAFRKFLDECEVRIWLRAVPSTQEAVTVTEVLEMIDKMIEANENSIALNNQYSFNDKPMQYAIEELKELRSRIGKTE